MKRTLPILLLPVALLAAGCSTKFIGETQIEDTHENREVLRFLEQYRRAVEDRDVQRILEMTSDRFFEDPGTPHEPRDDYDKAGLAKRLEESFAHVRDQYLQITARKIEWEEVEDRATGKTTDIVSLDYFFDYRFRLELPGGGTEDWRREMDVNRVRLIREGDTWRFLSGL